MMPMPLKGIATTDSHYENAIKCLNSRRTPAQPLLGQMKGSDDMSKWLELLTYSQRHLGTLNVIHVAGTNGKGSTCAYISSILQSFGCKVGLYTSPHLRKNTDMDIPRYLQLLTLLSFHVFLKEQVDVAIYEPHMGGEFDATNIVSSPVVTVVTRIAEDHVKFLGLTIADIACHKAGIFMSGCPAFSVPQEEEVVRVFVQRAEEKEYVTLSFVEPDSSLDVSRYQMENCSLARAVALEWMSCRKPDKLTNLTEPMQDIIDRGIRRLDWLGRYQLIEERR
ncbi:folylpolyglutamate synthase [Penicillium angulare]|uniref:folylpolyglutamate synthase n=1 Tax=Penicillium angulare TaxID=116970 RepID=UPI0025414FA0|nr:folylpolyglutamate synthase [Penicillium angulare]KAJ5278668.1 folylpolyglutamate synthase [Penicillium angulare]